MHFTFLYDGAAQRTGEYATLEEAVRSIEMGQVDRTAWSIQYTDPEGGTVSSQTAGQSDGRITRGTEYPDPNLGER